MSKPPLTPMAARILEVLRQLRVDGRRHVVSWKDPSPTSIPRDAPLARFPIVSMPLLKAELLALPSTHPGADVSALHTSIEHCLGELCVLGLVRPIVRRPGCEPPITYERPDGALVNMYYEWMAAGPGLGAQETVLLNMTVGGVVVGGYNIELEHEMFELTPEGARIPLTRKRRRKRVPAKRPKRTGPTEKERQAMVLRDQRFTFKQIADELGVTPQRASRLVKNGLARQSSTGRSVRAIRLPTDHRGQITTPGRSGKRCLKPISSDE